MRSSVHISQELYRAMERKYNWFQVIFILLALVSVVGIFVGLVHSSLLTVLVFVLLLIGFLRLWFTSFCAMDAYWY